MGLHDLSPADLVPPETEPTDPVADEIVACNTGGPSRAEQLRRMTPAQRRRGFASKLRTMGASRTEVRRAARPRSRTVALIAAPTAPARPGPGAAAAAQAPAAAAATLPVILSRRAA